MKIAGLVKSTLIDYPGKVAAIVFTQGCNFRCGFCHNPDLIPLENKQLEINANDVFDFLETRRGKLDGVVITGGEPLIQSDILSFIKKIKEMGFLVKLDTNGSNPLVLRQIIDQKLVDYVAMDIKNSLSSYPAICGFSDIDKVLSSVDLVMNSGVDYEFRTTVLPRFHSTNELIELAKIICGAKRFTIQGFRPNIVFDETLRSERSFTREELLSIKEIFNGKVDQVIIHDNIA